MAVISDREVYRGEDVTLSFTMTPAEDISGWTIAFTIAKSPNSPKKLISKECVLVTPASGTFKVDLLSTETDLPPAVYAWDAWRTTAGSKRFLAGGLFSILPSARLPPA